MTSANGGFQPPRFGKRERDRVVAQLNRQPRGEPQPQPASRPWPAYRPDGSSAQHTFAGAAPSQSQPQSQPVFPPASAPSTSSPATPIRRYAPDATPPPNSADPHRDPQPTDGATEPVTFEPATEPDSPVDGLALFDDRAEPDTPRPGPADGPDPADSTTAVADGDDPSPVGEDSDILQPGDGDRVRGGTKRRMRKVKDPNSGLTFAVPLPGGSAVNPRRVSHRWRIGVTVLATVTVATIALLAAFLIGITQTRVADAPIPEEEVARYNLTSYDMSSAAAFGESYVRECLTRHPTAVAEGARSNALENLGVVTDPMCEANDINVNEEPLPTRAITSITFAGPTGEGENMSTVRYLAYDVYTTDGLNGRFVVPVHLDDPATGAGPRIAGTMGLLPLPELGRPAPDDPNLEVATDTQLAGQWRDQLMAEFMSAWTGSTPALEQFTSEDASESAVTGLHGLIEDVAVEDVTVMPDPTVPEDNGVFQYSDGSTVTAHVSTVGHPVGTDPTVTAESTYRVHLRFSDSGQWLVTDITGGSLPGEGEVTGENEPTRPRPEPAPDDQNDDSGDQTESDDQTESEPAPDDQNDSGDSGP